MKETKRIQRLTKILTQLQSKTLITAKELADKHQVSIRTIYRDIRTLEQAGIPITVDEGKGYQLIQGYQLPPIMFTENEANALITAHQIVRQNKDASLIQHYDEAVTKILAVLRHRQKTKAELLSQRIQVRNSSAKNTTSDILIVLQSAITNFRLIRIKYRSLQEKVTERTVEPFAMFSTQDNWILIAYCRLRNAFRSFRMDLIDDLKLLPQDFQPHDITLQEYFEYCIKKSYTPDTRLSPKTMNLPETKYNFMQTVSIHSKMIIGKAIRTCNANQQSSKDIPELWNDFMKENAMAKIPNKVSNTIYCVYTHYEGDHNQAYTTLIGCEVSSSEDIPEKMEMVTIEAGNYAKFEAKGDLTSNLLYDIWMDISKRLAGKRKFRADFEVYDDRAMNPKKGIADIFVGVQ